MAILSSQTLDVGKKLVYPSTIHLLSRCLDSAPNHGHLAIAALNLPSVMQRITPSAMAPPLHVTQNIDDLSLHSLQSLPESVATSALEALIQMHGSLFKTRCLSCNHVGHSYERHLAASFKDCIDVNSFIKIPTDRLPHCGGDEWSGSNRFGQCGGLLRPDVVWFGEIPPLMGEIARKITWCDLLIVVGTSSTVSFQIILHLWMSSNDTQFKLVRYNLHPALHLKSKGIMAKWPSSIYTHLTNMMKPIFSSSGVVTLLCLKYLT